MRISELLRQKGGLVVTISPDRPVTELLDKLATNGVGALVVSADGQSVDGIVSERDVVRKLQRFGPGLLQEPVSEIMSRDVQTCPPATEIEELAKLMTNGRFRHVPVVDGDHLVGIVSIGDVVKHRMDELEGERDHLQAYINT
ncbi:CBS domain-containing protein [Kineosporia sp. NBRC 101731]|uniref:CBS domain-containing protein n=1 Tax=Kineosporia sp. NBRC 101731 TaxID=3032199 RepID=UPI0024A31DDD|nr:CBS domain-containing protein [Kineosporia sp. NBRC 101731]GLY27519.1 signal transduction protein [Kineosporia sp. NBRC 101731]